MSRIGKYEIESEVGRGGVGRVYRAFDPTVGRLVALKVLNAETDQELALRFSQEAAAAGNLHHRSIVTIYEFGRDESQPYLVMEFLEGRNLQEIIASGDQTTVLEAIRIMSQAGEGLRCAHQHGIVHRDIKPANIMLTSEGAVKLMDFGIARVKSDSAGRLTQKGDLVGTLYYMSPEQFGGKEADQLCDIFSFGVAYYELLTGRHPFPAVETASLVHKIINEAPVPLRSLNPDVPEELDRIVSRAMAKDRRQRYQHLDDLLFDTAPILMRLQSERAALLVTSAQQLFAKNRIEEAYKVIREVLSLNPSNQDGWLLRAQIQESLEAARHKAELLAEAKTKLSQDDLSGAGLLISEVLSLEPSHPEALAVEKEVQLGKEARDQARLLRQQVLKARGLMLIGEYDRALTLLSELHSAHPEATQVSDLLSQVNAIRAESAKLQERNLRIQTANRAMEEAQLEQARALIDDLLSDSPATPDIVELNEKLGRLEYHERRRKERAQFVAEGERLATAGDWDALLPAMENALREFPDDDSFAKHLEQGHQVRTARERERSLLALVGRIREHQKRDELAEAAESIYVGLLEFPEEPELLQLQTELRAHLEKARRRGQADRQRDVIREAITRNCPRAALTLIDQGRDAGVPEAELNRLQTEAREKINKQGSPNPAPGTAKDQVDRRQMERQTEQNSGPTALPFVAAVSADAADVEVKANRVLSRVTQVLRGFFA